MSDQLEKFARPHVSRLRWLAVFVAIGCLSGALIGLFEAVFSSLAYRNGLHGVAEIVLLASTCVLISSAMGFLAGLVCGVTAFFVASQKKPWVPMLVSTSLLVGFAIVLVTPWKWFYWRELAAGLALLAACSMIYHWLYHFFGTRRGFRWVTAPILLLLFGITYAVDTTLYVRLYTHLHAVLALVGFALIAAFVELLVRKPLLQSPRALFGVITVVVGISSLSALHLPSNQRVKTLAITRCTYQSKFVRLLQKLFDADGDGYSTLFYGGDCNDWNAAIHPGAPEDPQNLTDDNCNGVQWAQIGAPYRPSPTMIKPPPNILFLSIDAARARNMSFLGYSRPTTPNLKLLAARSTVFSAAQSATSWTHLSLRAMLDGRYLTGHPAHDQATQPNLIERLRSVGYRAQLFCGDTTLELTRNEVERLPSLNRQKYEGQKGVTNLLRYLERLRSPQQRQFLWIHFFEAHRRSVRSGHESWGKRPLDHYDRSLHRADHHIGELLQGMKKLGVLRQYLIVFFSDHGEEFGEHGGEFHGSSVYQEQIHIPLIIHVPGLKQQRVSTPVSLIDLYPTLAALYRFDYPKWRPGRSLTAALLGQPSDRANVPIFSSLNADEKYMRASITMGSYKLVVSRAFNLAELYDLRRDPTEEYNVYDDRPVIAAKLMGALNRIIDNFIPEKLRRGSAR